MNNLKILRRSRGLSLRDVEQETGISNAYLSQLEIGRAVNPTLDKARTLARFFNVTVDELFPEEVLV